MESFAAKVLFAAPAHEEEIIVAKPAGPEVEFVCPFCGETYPVSKELSGKKIVCRNCREASLVDAPKPLKRRRSKSRYSWQLVWLCFALAFITFALGLVIGRFSR
jgi:transposase-like protein